MDSPISSPNPVYSEASAQALSRGSNRLPLLLLVLVIVLILAFTPTLMQSIQYHRTLGEVEALQKTLPDLNLKALGKAFSLVYRKVKSSVVHIDTVRSIRGRPDDFFSMFNGRDRIYEAQGQASGVIVDATGYIITNLHVIEEAETVNVQLDDGRSFMAEVMGTDPKIDLAVLKINADGLTAATWGNSDQLEVGEMVWAIGNPFGLDQTITAGIVSAKGRHGFGQSIYQEFLQTDVAINPGNSGGPLVDINGEVVGINTAIVGRGYQGISFAIPSNLAQETYTKIRKDGKVIRAYLGVELGMPTGRERLNSSFDRPVGALVRSVTPNSPAKQAEIQAGDVIIEWNNQPVADYRELTLMIARTPVGSKVPLKIIRDGKEISLEVTVIEKPVESR